jgi:hypothetical protein
VTAAGKTTVKRLARRALSEGYRAVAPELRRIADGEDGADAGEAWQAAAASVGILYWTGEFAAAAELAEQVVRRDAPAGGALCDQRKPFAEVFVAAQLHAGVPAAPRLEALAGVVPEGRVLQKWLASRARKIGSTPLPMLLPNFAPWDQPPGPIEDQIGGRYVDSDYASLREPERRVLWEALRTTNRAEQAVALMDANGGAVPPVWPVCTWLAGALVNAGQAERAERILLDAHELWIPVDVWDVLPSDPVLQPAVRPAVTERVRERYLEPAQTENATPAGHSKETP